MKHKYEEKRVIGLLLAPVIVVSALSTVSFAQPQPQSLYHWDVNVDGELLGDGFIAEEGELASPSISTASNSQAMVSGAVPDGDMMANNVAPPVGDSLINIDWMQATVGTRLLFHSSQPSYRPSEGFEVLDNELLETRLKVTIPYASAVANNEETWIVGRIPGLNLPAEQTDAMVLQGILIGYASLRYSEDGTISIHTAFTDGMTHFQTVYITYTYEASWIPVSQITPVGIQLGDWADSETIYLLPSVIPEESESSEETTSVEETTEIEESSSQGETLPSEETTEVEETTKTETSSTEQTTSQWQTGHSKTRQKSSGSSKTNSGIGIKPQVQSETPVLEVTSEDVDTTEAVEREKVKASIEAKDLKQGIAETPVLQDSGLEAMVAVKTVNKADDYIDAGGTITYEIEIRNESQSPIENLRIRDYLPEHTSFAGTDHLGNYGVIDGRQHVTWNIENMEPGEVKYCTLTVQVFVCTSERYQIINRVYYQTDDKSSVNDPRDPVSEQLVSSLTVG